MDDNTYKRKRISKITEVTSGNVLFLYCFSIVDHIDESSLLFPFLDFLFQATTGSVSSAEPTTETVEPPTPTESVSFSETVKVATTPTASVSEPATAVSLKKSIHIEEKD